MKNLFHYRLIKFGIIAVISAFMTSQMATTYAKAVKLDDHDADIKAAITQHDTDIKADIATHDGSMTTEHSDLDTKLDEILAAVQNGGGLDAPVEKTGQKTFFQTGDDGDLERGVAWPNPRFTDNGDETVTDNLTGLIWTKDANLFGAAQTWPNALTSCNNLVGDGSISGGPTEGSVAGDWHLANVKEYVSLLHYGVFNPAVPNTLGTGQWIQGDPFNNVQSSFYWSATTTASHTTIAWFVNFFNGSVSLSDKDDNNFVWCVRGGQ